MEPMTFKRQLGSSYCEALIGQTDNDHTSCRSLSEIRVCQHSGRISELCQHHFVERHIRQLYTEVN
jgi:hypothetical protein